MSEAKRKPAVNNLATFTSSTLLLAVYGGAGYVVGSLSDNGELGGTLGVVYAAFRIGSKLEAGIANSQGVKATRRYYATSPNTMQHAIRMPFALSAKSGLEAPIPAAQRLEPLIGTVPVSVWNRVLRKAHGLQADNPKGGGLSASFWQDFKADWWTPSYYQPIWNFISECQHNYQTSGYGVVIAKQLPNQWRRLMTTPNTALQYLTNYERSLHGA